MISFKEEFIGEWQISKIHVLDATSNLGYFILAPHSKELYEVHTQLSPAVYGSAVIVAKQFLQWLFKENKDIEVLFTKVPVNNSLAKRLAKKSGMSFCGSIPFSFKDKENNLITQDLFSISRKEI